MSRPKGSKNIRNRHSEFSPVPLVTPTPQRIYENSSFNFLTCQTRLHPDLPPNMPDVHEAIKVTHANLNEMTILLNRKRSTLKTFIEARRELLEIWEEEREILLDKAEQVVQHLALTERDPTTIRFLLSTLGKARGYAPKVEHSGEDGKPLQLEIVLNEATASHIQNLNEKNSQEKFLDELLNSSGAGEKEN